MRLNQKIEWLSAPSLSNLAVAWVLGMIVGHIVIGLGQKFTPYLLAPYVLVSLMLSLVTGVLVWREWYPEEMDVFSLKGWKYAVMLFLGFLLLEVLFAAPIIKPALWKLSGLGKLLWCIVLTGFIEELWWRGVWFAMFKNRPLVCIVAGSVIFGLAHFQLHGMDKVITASFVGLAYAVARYKGASIGVLALAHGFNDWIGQGQVIGWRWHAGTYTLQIAIVCISLVLVVGMLKGRQTNGGSGAGY